MTPESCSCACGWGQVTGWEQGGICPQGNERIPTEGPALAAVPVPEAAASPTSRTGGAGPTAVGPRLKVRALASRSPQGR